MHCFDIRNRLVALALTQHIAVLLQRAADQLSLLPQVRRKEAISIGNGNEGGLERVLQRLGRSRGCRVDIADTGELE